MNKVLLIGRLGRDPEQHWTANGAQVVTMSVATTESYTDRAGNRVEQTEWHRVVTFQRTASICAQYLTKGRLVYVEGKIQTRKWQDQQGQDRYMTEIKAQRVNFLDRKGDTNGPSGGQSGGRQQGQRQGHPPADYEDLGPAFPSECSGMGDMPF